MESPICLITDLTSVSARNWKKKEKPFKCACVMVRIQGRIVLLLCTISAEMRDVDSQSD